MITKTLGLKYIKIPNMEKGVDFLVTNFEKKHRFPQCIGTVDGTNIFIKQPAVNSTDYLNRKYRYSINVQTTNFTVVLYSSATFRRRAVSSSVQLKTFSAILTLEPSLWAFWRMFALQPVFDYFHSEASSQVSEPVKHMSLAQFHL